MIKFFLIRDDIEDERGKKKDGNYLDDLITFKFFWVIYCRVPLWDEDIRKKLGQNLMNGSYGESFGNFLK